MLSDRHAYRFRYTEGARRAHAGAGFDALLDFPKLTQAYESAELFPLFKNRIISPGRRDFADYLHMLDLPVTAEPAEILAVGGGYKATDSFEVFPKIERRADGFFSCRFFLHGWRHVNDAALSRIKALQEGEPLYVTIELTNPATGLAVQIQSEDYHMIGWAPRYLVNDLIHAIALSPGDYSAKVVRINPAPAPSKQRLLVELTGRWPDYEPMVESLDEEQQRAAKEGLSEEELALFDLLQRDKLSHSAREQVKQASRELLTSLQSLLSRYERWAEKEQTRAEIEIFILDNLYEKLPSPPFTENDKQEAAQIAYQHIWRQSASQMFQDRIC
jgi:hypothetical protein